MTSKGNPYLRQYHKTTLLSYSCKPQHQALQADTVEKLQKRIHSPKNLLT